MTETIYALSSGQGRAGIAVWRVSGPRAVAAAQRLAGLGEEIRPRAAHLRTIMAEDGSLLDQGLVLFFPGPNSVTGEDLVEFHLHGSVAVGRRFSQALEAVGCVPAEAGAFTLRAFQNGKMDLLAVEGLGELLSAETEAQRAQATELFHSAARKQAEVWRAQFLDILSRAEAAIDFPDEDDVTVALGEDVVPRIRLLGESLRGHAQSGQGARLLREGVKIAIVGAPNVGKSSFLNRLVGEDRAIVSPIAGTTRDVVSARLELAGRLVEVLDTAGIRESTDDAIEREGILRSERVRDAADFVIEIRDLSAPDVSRETSSADVLVWNKADLATISETPPGFLVSVETGEGWHPLIKEVEKRIGEIASPALFSHDRQLQAIAAAGDCISRAARSVDIAPELMSEDVRLGLSHIRSLTGEIGTEEVLGEIFSAFCIGK